MPYTDNIFNYDNFLLSPIDNERYFIVPCLAGTG